jgi:hypothetical protein
MAFSLEARRYLAVYGEWKKQADDAKYARRATECMRETEPFSVSIQLADENLGRRPARFVADANMARLDHLRAKYDPFLSCRYESLIQMAIRSVSILRFLAEMSC